MRNSGFVAEGTALALPLCVPGLSAPPPEDECPLDALAVTPDGRVLLAGGGRGRVHLYVGSTASAAMAVGHLATAPGSRVLGIAPLARGMLVATDAPGLVSVENPWLPDHVLQEPFVPAPRVRQLPWTHPHPPRWLAAVPGADTALALAGDQLVEVSWDGDCLPRNQVGAGPVPTASGRSLQGCDDRGEWWWDGRELVRAGSAPTQVQHLSRQPVGVELPVLAADSRGELWQLGGDRPTSLGRLPLPDPGPLVVTPDGRAFGVCGSGIARLWTLDRRGITDLGVMAAAVGARRYGYAFSCAGVGADGQVLLGERDDGAHLWVYVPSVQEQPGGVRA